VSCGLLHDQRDLKSTTAGKDCSSPAVALIREPHDVSAASVTLRLPLSKAASKG
jgi:hypothetical protein